MTKGLVRLVAGASALSIATAVAAQTPPVMPVAEAGDGAPEEIIVTAQKREQRLQDVPIAVTAFSREFLDRGALRDIREIVQLAPGVSITSNNTARAEGVRIRGVGTASFSDGVTGSVATIVDGVVLGRQAQGLFELNDIERVEVLRGPQGTLYGATATAGVINIVSQRPSDELSAAADVQYGSKDEFRARATVAGPIVVDKLLSRVSGYYSRRDGEITNIFNGAKLNGKEEYGLRGQVELQASDELRFNLRADYISNESVCCSFTARSAPVAAAIAPIVASESNRDVNLNAPESRQDNRAWGLALEGNYDLGSAVITSITAYRDWDFSDGGDSDGSPRSILDFAGTVSTSTQFSQELRITNSSGPLQYIAGLYYFNQDLRADSLFRNRLASVFVGGATGAAIGEIRETAERAITTEQMAAFAQLDYFITPKLQLTGGLRFTRINLGLDFSRTNTNALLGTITGAPFAGLLVIGVPTTFETENNDSDVSGKAGVQYFVNDDAMVFASFTRGYKGPAIRGDSGDPIAGPDVAATSRVGAESVDSYEAGVRTQFLDRRLTVNLTAYKSSFKNFQANTVNPLNVLQQSLVNAGGVKTKGVEVEVSARPARGLDVGFNFAYVDATYGNILVSCSSFPTEPGCGRSTPTAPLLLNLNGRQFQNAPRITALATLGYEAPVTDGLNAFFRGDLTLRDRVRFAFNSDPFSEQESYPLLNLVAGVGSADGKYRLSFYAKNATNEQYALFLARNPLTGGISQFNGQERSFGAILATRF
jgi:iron complex outermembrane receptor protein